ncbi:MAG: tRNA (guanine(10)-N(2))-dimethyltransferase [Asgard group archaeon]|nr:tRNA (guanine(10)-N(2))-dimethyltransferase [Asgard group archaeon]
MLRKRRKKVIDFPLKTIVEGKTSIIVPDVDAIKEPTSNFPPADAPVFYNKVMELNRDFALATLRVFMKLYDTSKSFLYCEPMAGSGIRSVRVANEIDNLEVIINDRNPTAVELIKKNVKQLKLKKKTKVYAEDANSLMLQYASRGDLFKIIDIDPFGSPSSFIDSTAQAIRKDGLIAVTSTDMATMCGVYPKACIRKYLSKPIHSSIAHEISVRMLIGYTAAGLARHEKATVPLFAHSTAHYIRIYVLAKKGITKAKETMAQLGYLAHCQECFTIDHSIGIINQLPKTCPNCQTKWLIGGPYWLGQLYNEKFVTTLESELSNENSPYNTIKKMRKIVSLVKEEVKTNSSRKAMIGFYDLHQIADKLNIPSPKLDPTIHELQDMGFIATRTHFRTNSIKTDAPVDTVIKAMKKILKL